MAEEGREIPQEYDLSLGSKETEMPLNDDVSISPTKKRERTTTTTTTVYLFGTIISQESSPLDSKKTELPLTDVAMSPTKKRSRTSMTEVARKIKETNEEREEEERTGASTQLTISLTQTTNMIQDSRQILNPKESSFLESKERGVRLFGVTIWERGESSMTGGQTSMTGGQASVTGGQTSVTGGQASVTGGQTDSWTIEKKLMVSDLNSLSRLILKKSDAESHIMKYLSPDVQAKIQKGDGVNVKVFDHDTGSEHDVVFKRWVGSSRSYVLNGGWVKEFVRRRELKKGETIGLFWGDDSRLHFSVLSRPPPADQNSDSEEEP